MTDLPPNPSGPANPSGVPNPPEASKASGAAKTSGAPKPSRPAPTSGRGLRIALALSVAVNLAVAGIIGGALLRPDGPRGRDLPRDLGFGVFSQALTPENRADLRRRLIRAAPDFAPERRGMRQDLNAILAALRADPFDPEALELAMQSQIARFRSRLEVGQGLLLDFLSDLPVQERRAFADRLEQTGLRRAPKPGGPDGN